MIILYAALLNNKLVLAAVQAEIVKKKPEILSKKQYFCPHCKQQVQLIIKKSSAYFKHAARVGDLNGEKKEHQLSKFLLKKALQNANFPAQTEVTLANGQLRADVLASPKLAFEVQCAPLNRSEFWHRHNLYWRIGVKDIWLVGQRHFLHENFRKSQLIFFRKNKQWHDYYFEIDPYQKILRLKFNVLLEPITDKYHYQVENFSLDNTGLKKLWLFRPQLKKYYVNPTEQRNYLQRKIRHKTFTGMQIASMLYQKHMTIKDLPEWVFSNFRRVNTHSNEVEFFT